MSAHFPLILVTLKCETCLVQPSVLKFYLTMAKAQQSQLLDSEMFGTLSQNK